MRWIWVTKVTIELRVMNAEQRPKSKTLIMNFKGILVLGVIVPNEFSYNICLLYGFARLAVITSELCVAEYS